MTVAMAFIFFSLMANIPAFIAKEKGHDFGTWWIYGALLLVVALPHALLIERSGGSKICPSCTEPIKRDANVCKHCNRDQPPMPSSETKSGDDYIPEVF